MERVKWKLCRLVMWVLFLPDGRNVVKPVLCLYPSIRAAIRAAIRRDPPRSVGGEGSA